MHSWEFVLDTCSIKIAENPCNPRSLETLALLHEIRSHHKIALDHGRTILREYFRNLDGNSHAGQWVRITVARADKTMWRAGKVPRRHSQVLLTELKFDPSDIVFVGVAYETVDRIIVTEDSDYSSEVRKYLSKEMGINVVSVSEALEKAQTP
jgi:hypothetical protein